MKVLHLSFSLLNGGKENLLVDIAIEQQKLGNTVGILIVNEVYEASILNRIPETIRLFLLKRKTGIKGFLSLPELFRIMLLDFKPDIIHAHDASFGKMFKFFIKPLVVLTVHGPGISISDMKHFDKLFAISNAVRKDVENRGGLHCKVVYNGIRTSGITRKTYYPDSGKIRLVHVKRLNHERKGKDLLIRAIGSILEHKRTDLELHLVGDGPSRPFLETMVKENQLNEFIFFHGNKDREWIYKHLCEFDIFVHPSRFEGFGLSITEAMSARLPVISSAIEGPLEILQGGQFGFLFENDNYEDLEQKILEVIERLKEKQIEDFTQKAAKYCLENFDIKQTAANYLKNY